MTAFDKKLTEFTNKENPIVHGIVFKGVDKTGKEFYTKEVGCRSLGPDAEPITGDDFFKLASSTKLITSIALLQCVERGLIGLDEPVYRVLPELEKLEVLSWKEVEKKEFELRKSKNTITSRQLLTHTSGIGYDNMSPLLGAWRESRGEVSILMTHKLSEAAVYPLVFEPGEGWAYGAGLDWAGYLVRRLNGNISLEEYLLENVFKKVGCSMPYPTFDLNKHPDAKARLVQVCEWTPEDSLKASSIPFGENPADEWGGGGITCTVNHFIAILADIISDSPKLLKAETATALFAPQLLPNTPALKCLGDYSDVYKGMTSTATDPKVNHGLGGLIIGAEVPKFGQPDSVLTWGGYTSTSWIASRKHGVAGFAATQIIPTGRQPMRGLLGDWKRDFWAAWNAYCEGSRCSDS